MKGGIPMAIRLVESNGATSDKKTVVLKDSKPKKIVTSKTMVINELSVTIVQNFDEDVDFQINTIPGILSDNKTIPKLDITAKEDVDFDESLTLAKLEAIIRRCGILDEYKEYFTQDPEIVIDHYTLTIRKTFRYFNEFKEGIFIASDIVT